MPELLKQIVICCVAILCVIILTMSLCYLLVVLTDNFEFARNYGKLLLLSFVIIWIAAVVKIMRLIEQK
jgi:hypothetical protein